MSEAAQQPLMAIWRTLDLLLQQVDASAFR